MAQGKKKKGVYGEEWCDFCMDKGADHVTRGERNLCTILGGCGFTALFFFGGEFLRAADRLSRQRRRTGGSERAY